MKNKGWILLLLAGGAAYFLYQRTARAGQQSESDRQRYLESLRAAALQQQRVEAMRNQNRAVISDSGTIVPPPAATAPAQTSVPPPAYIPRPSTKFGPVMVP